jgi:sulfur-oxidizing protein SoxX
VSGFRGAIIKLIVLGSILTSCAASVVEDASVADDASDRLQQGKAIAFDRNKGNCLSCHMMDDGELPGNSGPPLLMMQARFPERAALREQIYDANERNPISVMPPYGRHHILNEAELDLVVDYVHSL